jgi:hypothetical protein
MAALWGQDEGVAAGFPLISCILKSTSKQPLRLVEDFAHGSPEHISDVGGKTIPQVGKGSMIAPQGLGVALDLR